MDASNAPRRGRSLFQRRPLPALMMALSVLIVASACIGGSSSATQTAEPTTNATAPTAIATTTEAGSTAIATAVESPSTSSPATAVSVSPPVTPTPTKPPPSAASLAALKFQLDPVVKGLNQPTAITNDGVDANRLYIVEKGGKILVEQNGKVSNTPFLDITSRVGSDGSEQGLLGLVFHPDYKDNGFFYVDYTDRNGNTIIARFTATTDRSAADPSTFKQILEVDQPYDNHNGGQLAFGPDGMLYIGMGDGGSEGDPQHIGQNTNTLLGKILRIDVDHGDPYSIPPGNPFADGKGGKPEIWDYGFRNPWRFGFDSQTHDLYIGDVGQDTWEEVDYIAAGTKSGLNFGWSIMEGDHCYRPSTNCNQTGLVLPVTEIEHPAGCAIIGGYVYRGTKYAAIDGAYFFTDYCSGTVWALTRDPAGAWVQTQVISSRTSYAGYSSFGQDLTGELYITDLSSGVVYHLTEKP